MTQNKGGCGAGRHGPTVQGTQCGEASNNEGHYDCALNKELTKDADTFNHNEVVEIHKLKNIGNIERKIAHDDFDA